eukprot:CAMPEP_0183382884 /NCGR_PEP_ID=MMETSP0164_2-20130417/127170_1 /TAXON_ID=221442 /ORGANISM="Coccolithus pelagicus ssp braarudi, Strain PLY182g" /LENGTH=115 /DNA_ID=CAMNT_0025560509 /DNA_START=701 /DNA_END=1044 /DNA_ORIENTATION=-
MPLQKYRCCSERLRTSDTVNESPLRLKCHLVTCNLSPDDMLLIHLSSCVTCCLLAGLPLSSRLLIRRRHLGNLTQSRHVSCMYPGSRAWEGAPAGNGKKRKSDLLSSQRSLRTCR